MNFITESRPNLIIVDISQKTQMALDIIVKISNTLKNSKIIVLSYDMSPETVIKALRAGAIEFLVKPLIESEFIQATEKLKDLILGNINDTTKCKVITTFSNKGGIGKTAIATNLAVELANMTKERVALIDLNMQIGDVTTFLDLKLFFNISYMLQNLNKINEDFLLSTLEKYKDTSLYVLADPPYFKQVDDISSKDIQKLFNILRDTFSYVVVDTSGSFEARAMNALENSDLIFLVTIVNLPALRNCQRCLELFEKLGFDNDKVQVLINRYMENDEIKAEDVEEVLGIKLYWKIPNNYFTMKSAINKGVPVADVNSDSNVALSYKNLALMVSDDIYRQKLHKRERFEH